MNTAALVEILQYITGWDCPDCLFSKLGPDHMSFDIVGYPSPIATKSSYSKRRSSKTKKTDTKPLKRDAPLFNRQTSSRKWNKCKQKVAVKAWLSWEEVGGWMCYNS